MRLAECCAWLPAKQSSRSGGSSRGRVAVIALCPPVSSIASWLQLSYCCYRGRAYLIIIKKRSSACVNARVNSYLTPPVATGWVGGGGNLSWHFVQRLDKWGNPGGGAVIADWKLKRIWIDIVLTLIYSTRHRLGYCLAVRYIPSSFASTDVLLWLKKRVALEWLLWLNYFVKQNIKWHLITFQSTSGVIFKLQSECNVPPVWQDWDQLKLCQDI